MKVCVLLFAVLVATPKIWCQPNENNDTSEDVEVVLDTLSGTNIAEGNQKLHPSNILRPISEKLSTITNFFTYPYHPNYGGVHFLNPAQLWEKLSVPNNHAAIFGLGGWDKHDYPFAYRNTKTKQKK